MSAAPEAPRCAVVVVLGLHAAVLLAWIAQAELPAGCRDEFMVLEESVKLALGLGRTPWPQLQAISLHAYYPPGTHLPGLVGALVGGYRTILLLQALLWLPLLAVGTALVARRWVGPWGALAAVSLTLSYPAIAESAHRLEPNLGAAACTAAALAAWLRSDDLRAPGPRRALGLLLGLGLLSERLGVLPLLAAPLALSVLRARDRRSWRGLAEVLGIAALVAGWWYAFFLPRFLGELGPQLLAGEIGARGQLEEVRPPLLPDLLHYLLLWPDSQLGPAAGVAALAALLAALLRGRERRELADLLVFLLAGLLLFTLIRKRQAYYTIPLLSAAAVLTVRAGAEVLRRLPRRLAAPVAVSALGLAALPSLVALSGEPPDLDSPALRWLATNRSPLPDAWVGERYPTGGPPDRPGLDLDGLVERLEARGVGPDRPIGVWSDDGSISESQLVSLLRLKRRSLAAEGITLDPDWFEDAAPRLGALIAPRPRAASCAVPARDDVVPMFAVRQGWEERPELLRALEALAARLRVLEDREVGGDSRLCVWVDPAG